MNSTFKQLEDITDVYEMTNAKLKRLIQKIEVDKEGNVDIYLRIIGDLGLDEAVLIEGTENSQENNDLANKLNINNMSSNIKIAPIRHNHTCGIIGTV